MNDASSPQTWRIDTKMLLSSSDRKQRLNTLETLYVGVSFDLLIVCVFKYDCINLKSLRAI